MNISLVSVVLSGRGLCVGLITRPEKTYRLWCLTECDRKALIMRKPWPTKGWCANGGGICFLLLHSCITYYIFGGLFNYLA